MRMYTKSGRSRWPYVIAAALVVAVVAGGIAYSAAQPGGTSTAVASNEPSTSAPATAGTSGAGDADNGAAPTGCLGGQDRTADMVVAAQKSAKHTSFGAVEVAASIYRWLWQSPHPAAAEANAVSAGIMAKSANDSFKNLAASYSAAPDMTGGKVPEGTPYHLSTTNGLWSISEGSDGDQVKVNLAAEYVINGELSSSKVAVISMTMIWEADSWHLLSGGTPDQDKLAAGGNRFTGGC
ncbi:hypothetical protein QN345_01705 [Cryobacterium sp. 10I1]|uniref:hypothetical protein n=1 Tax=unclassified Cryobacterium TaxID=2649013 RepID=UPI002AB5B059|nr:MULTISPECIES: hypothetical protein [unclassified Cryobacterium]MDY7544574.1 hypothetical protein [Cryobacterium sp. 5B3]MEB0000123.1 hypothetical protein [Cryobacterium sp. RTS3]MEB0202483.1 hypothetical protein [Cryobacterium sp. 5I3]MEB0267424.1 hypothetical protein [Cryobacterium sp. 10I5]MEB0275123.1 hypothetical protein [Cryobacterium sp. 5B3]